MGSSKENSFDGVYRRTGTDDNFAQLGGKFLYQGSITIKRFENISQWLSLVWGESTKEIDEAKKGEPAQLAKLSGRMICRATVYEKRVALVFQQRLLFLLMDYVPPRDCSDILF